MDRANRAQQFGLGAPFSPYFCYSPHMDQETWQEFIPRSLSQEDGVFGSGAPEILAAKQMIRMACRAAVSQAEVQKELVGVLQTAGFEKEHVLRQVARLHAAWVWAEPVQDREADQLLETIGEGLRQFSDRLEPVEVPFAQKEAMRIQLADLGKLVRHVRFLHGVRMDAAESTLEVDPASGREVYVVRVDKESERG